MQAWERSERNKRSKFHEIAGVCADNLIPSLRLWLFAESYSRYQINPKAFISFMIS